MVEEGLPLVGPVAWCVGDWDVGGEVVLGGVFLWYGFFGVGDVEGDVEAGEFAFGEFRLDAGFFLGGDDAGYFGALMVPVFVGADLGDDEPVDVAFGAFQRVGAGVGLVVPGAACVVGFEGEVGDGVFGERVRRPAHYLFVSQMAVLGCLGRFCGLGAIQCGGCCCQASMRSNSASMRFCR